MNYKRSLVVEKSLATVESHYLRTMEQKPRIHDSYGILESVTWIWRIIGVFPYSIKYTMGVKNYAINKFYAAYCITTCIACWITYVIAYFHLHEWISNPMSIEHVTIIIRTSVGLMSLTMFNTWRLFRYKELTGSIAKMTAQDLLLERLGCRLDYESNARVLRTYVWSSLTVVVIFVGYDFYATTRVVNRISISWVFWSLPLVTQVVDLTVLASLVGLLGFKFRALNEKIITIAIRANASSPKVIVTSDVCANNLISVAKIHYNICAIGKRINEIFSWDIIINVVTAFIILSTTLYYIFDEVQRDDETDYIRIGTYLHWEFIHSVPIIVIVIICNWTTNQGIHTGKLIHEIRVVKADTRLYEAVKSFSLQLHHQKLEFNAGGFFPINSTLLQAMVGNITTYLVILIQFQPKLE